MLRQSFDYRKWIGLDIGVVTHHVGRVGPHCSRPAYPRHIAQALQPRYRAEDFWRYVLSPQAFRLVAELEPGLSTAAR